MAEQAVGQNITGHIETEIQFQRKQPLNLNLPHLWGHPEGTRFHQRAEGSRADHTAPHARSFAPPEKRLRSG
jgi:hypothetical protein